MEHKEAVAVDRTKFLSPLREQAVMIFALIHEGCHALNEWYFWAWQVAENPRSPPAVIELPKFQTSIGICHVAQANIAALACP